MVPIIAPCGSSTSTDGTLTALLLAHECARLSVQGTKAQTERRGAVAVQVSLPRPRGLSELPTDELVARAEGLARLALEAAAATLAH